MECQTETIDGGNTPKDPNNHEETLAIQLLRSSDTKIAAAAKRIFSTSFTQQPCEMTQQPGTINEMGENYYIQNSGQTTNMEGNTTQQVQQPLIINHHYGMAYSNNDEEPDMQMSTDVPQSGSFTPVITQSFNISQAPETITLDYHQAMSAADSPSLKDEEGKSSTERLKRRERNRMHARRTRQRKKEHLQNLQSRANELRDEQLRLKQIINENNTANILLVMCTALEDHAGKNSSFKFNHVDPKVDALLTRSADDIPNASKIPELPALILPSQNQKKRKNLDPGTPEKTQGDSVGDVPGFPFPDDGIDYTLLSKDRALCTPAELDKIRRERNRMHAKRTRDRKRIFMEEMEEMIKQLEEENKLLQSHIDGMNQSYGRSPTNEQEKLGSNEQPAEPTDTVTSLETVTNESQVVPSLPNEKPKSELNNSSLQSGESQKSMPTNPDHDSQIHAKTSNDHKMNMNNDDQHMSMTSIVSVSTVTSRSESLCDLDYNGNYSDSVDSSGSHGHKRMRVKESMVPASITTSTATSVRC